MPSRRFRTRTLTSASPSEKTKQLSAEILASKIVFKGRVFNVSRDRVREPNGITATREVIRHAGSVVVLAVDDDGRQARVLLERQYRYAAKDYMLELPAGRIDQGESALAAGKRELLEETGYTARHWKKALFFYPSPGFLDETMTIFLARGLKPGKSRPEADERIEHELVALPRLVEMVKSGTIRDGKTIAGVLWYVQTANSAA